MKLNLGVNREMHGKNKILEAATLEEGSGTEMTYHEIQSLLKHVKLCTYGLPKIFKSEAFL